MAAAKDEKPDEKQIALTVVEGDKDRLRREERAKYGPPVWSALTAAKTRPKEIPFIIEVAGPNESVIPVECWIRIKRLNDSEKSEWEFAGTETYVREDPTAASGRQLQVMRDISGSTLRLFEASIIDFKIATEELSDRGEPIIKTFKDYSTTERTQLYADWLPEQAQYFRTQIESFNGFSGNVGGG